MKKKNDNDKTIKIIEVESKIKKHKCPSSDEYTSSIHDKLKPISLKYLKLFEQDTKIIIKKKRFICHKCKKKFTESVDLNDRGKNISNKLEQKVLKELMDYNLSIKWIAKENGINSESVRKILKRAMINYPKQIKSLPRVISFYEFKADTQYGKYAFVLNNPIHKKCLDILPERKKSTW